MSALDEVLAAHTADWTDWATSETDHEHYRCLCGLVEWHVNSSIDYHQAHAEHVADALTKAGYGKLADAWDDGYRAGWSNRTRSIMGGFNYEQEVANTTPNPYRTTS